MPREDNPALRALQTAIELCGGSRRELARRIAGTGYRGVRAPISPQRINQWINRDHSVPIEVAPFVAAAVDGQVSVFDLCPHYEEGWLLIAALLKTAQQEPKRKHRILALSGIGGMREQ
jgi:DNA-binding transcriptional regulator YdaS (Cro superfamily)